MANTTSIFNFTYLNICGITFYSAVEGHSAQIVVYVCQMFGNNILSLAFLTSTKF